MKLTRKTIGTVSLLCASAFQGWAAEEGTCGHGDNGEDNLRGSGMDPVSVSKETLPKFSIKPRGRVHFDGALFSHQDAGLTSGVAIPEIRLGVAASYGKWSGIVEAAYGFGKVTMRDAFVQYSPDSVNSIKAGYFVTQFGLGAATAWSTRPSYVTPTADAFFDGAPRSIGIQYTFDGRAWFASAGVTFDSNSITVEPNKQGRVSWGGAERVVWRPFRNPYGLVAQIGFSSWLLTARHDRDAGGGVSPGYFDYSARYPVEANRVVMQQAIVGDSRFSLRLTPEWLFAKQRVACEGQYYYMGISRKEGLPSYNAHGAYILLRGLLSGKGYTYSGANCGLAQPASKSLELVLGYDWLKAECRKAGIAGGYSTDWSATMSYFINKYILVRLRYSYTDVHGSAVTPDTKVSILQARLQMMF